MGDDMRNLGPVALLLGAMPFLAFAIAFWFSDGAPFVPPGDRGNPQAALPADAVRSDPYTKGAPAQRTDRAGDSVRDVDGDWLRLHRLARDGDAEAALLLTILDRPRGAVAARSRSTTP